MGKKSSITKRVHCNYCGAHAVMVLDSSLHELTCQGCGAPLHHIKQMPQKRDDDTKYGIEHRTGWNEHKSPKKKRKKKKKSTFFDILEEVIDLID